MNTAFKECGYKIVLGHLNHARCDSLIGAVSNIFGNQNHKSPGIRNLLHACPVVLELAVSSATEGLLNHLGMPGAFPVRALYFDKSEAANWKVPWHQDLTIAVKERIETFGFGPWSIKDGVHHVQPSLEILESMVAIRFHLDDCGAENGALKVVPGSHDFGRLNTAAIEKMRREVKPVVCVASRGDALIMRPLILHASSAAKSPTHRRVIHIEYATGDLPNGLRWYEQAG